MGYRNGAESTFGPAHNAPGRIRVRGPFRSIETRHAMTDTLESATPGPAEEPGANEPEAHGAAGAAPVEAVGPGSDGAVEDPGPGARGTGEALKRAILAEARRALQAGGYSALSTRKIARAVGCTATSIYLYFQNKDALVHALIAEGFARLNGAIEESVTASGARTHGDRLRVAARAMIDFGLANPSYYEVMFMLRVDQLERFPMESYRDARRGLDDLVGSLGLPRGEGLVRATACIAPIHGLVSLLLMQRVDRGVDREALIERTIETACAGVLADDAALRAASENGTTDRGGAGDGDPGRGPRP